MTRDDLFTRLSRLSPSQFEEAIFRAGVPIEYIAGSSAAQATRSADAIRYLEQQNQLERLTRIFEDVTGDAPRGTPEIQLQEPLAGIDRPTSSRIRDLIQEYLAAPFAGRDREVTALHTWLSLPEAPLGLLAAEAGRGKSALLVRWSADVVAASTADLVYIPISIRFGTAHVAPVAKAIAGRLRHLMAGQQPIPINDPFAALDECKDILGTSWSGHRPLLVILDGLDEAIGWNPADLIPSSAGKGIKLLVAARGAATHWIEQLSWTSPRPFALEALDRTAVQALVASVSELEWAAGNEEAMERFQTLTGGDPLVVQLHLQLVKQDNDSPAVQRFNRLLQGDLSGGDPLKRFLDRWWDDQRVQWRGQGIAITNTIDYVLALLACAKGPLRLADLCALADCEPESVREALYQLSRLVIVDPARDRYVFSHSRLQDFFLERTREAGRLEAWERRYLDYAATRFEELSAELPADDEDFGRRFGYVLYCYALHLQDDAPDGLFKLMSRRWLDGWRRLEAEDGIYGGFYEDVSRAERHAQARRMLGEQMRGLLIKASVTSLSSNVPSPLMRRLVEARLWPLSRALRAIDRLVDNNERVFALRALAGGLTVPEQRKVLARATDLPEGYRTRALAWMMPDLAEIHREVAIEAILADRTLFSWHSFVDVNRLLEVVPHHYGWRLLAAARAMFNPELRLRALIALAGSTRALPTEDRKAVLTECEHLVAKIESAEHRAYYRLRIALATKTCDLDDHSRLLRATLDEIPALGSDGLSAINTLNRIADHVDGLDPTIRSEVIAALWRAIDTSDVPWLALSSLGPHLGQFGFASQVLERSASVKLDEHSRSMLLASLLPHAADHFDRVWQSLWELKRRYWMFQAVAPYLPLLSDEQRAMYLDEALDLVSRDPARSDLIGAIVRKMVASDRDAPRLLAAARALPDPTSRARRLADCAHLASEQERDSLVSEILQDAHDIASRHDKRQLLIQLAGLIQTDQVLLLGTLEVSSQIKDERSLAHALERVAVTLGKSSDSQGAITLAERAATTFARQPRWVLEAHVGIITVLPEDECRTTLWNTAVVAASRLRSAFERAYFLAALAPIAPAPVKSEHALVALTAVQRLEFPFEKAYTTIPLLSALDDESRNVKLKWVIAQLSQDMSRFERYLVVRGLMSQVAEIEIAAYRPSVDASIDEVLRRNLMADSQAGDKDELESNDNNFYLDKLAGALDLRRVRELIARLPPSAVSTLELLAIRLAKLGQRDESLDAVRRLESPGSRARALARLLAFVPTSDRAAVLAEARQNLEECMDPRERAESEAFLIEHLADTEREQRIVAALQHAPLIGHGESRHDTLHSLATSAAVYLPLDQLEAIWAELLQRMAAQRREEIVNDVIALLPIVSRLGGNPALRTLGETLLDVAEWFP